MGVGLGVELVVTVGTMCVDVRVSVEVVELLDVGVILDVGWTLAVVDSDIHVVLISRLSTFGSSANEAALR